MIDEILSTTDLCILHFFSRFCFVEDVPFAFYQTIKVPLAFEVCALETWTFQDSAFEGLAQFCKVSAPSEKLANKLRQQDILT